MKEFIDLITKGAVEIIAKPNSKKNNLYKNSKGFVVEIKAKAENNKANEQIEKFLTKIVGKEVKLVIGKTSKKKLVKIK